MQNSILKNLSISKGDVQVMSTKSISLGEKANDSVSPKEELVLLALYRKELYGLQIPEAISESSGKRSKISMGTLYPVLHSLERKQLVESRWGDERTERGGARRRYYRLTGSGECIIQDMQTFRINLQAWQPS